MFQEESRAFDPAQKSNSSESESAPLQQLIIGGFSICLCFFSLPELKVILVNSKVERNTSRMVAVVKEKLKKVVKLRSRDPLLVGRYSLNFALVPRCGRGNL